MYRGRCARFSLFLLLVAVCLVPGKAGAQTVVSNPTTLVFTPSADHNTVFSDGQPAVDHYDFNVYALGASQPFQTTDLGKPAPAADGLIYYDFSSSVASWPLPGGDYQSRVAASGPMGTGLSAPSNEFTFDSCTYTVSPASASLPASGGGTQVSVATSGTCTWTATSNASWVTLSSSGGTGNATVVATAASNTTSTSRQATLTVAGHAVTITEQGTSAPPSGTAPTAPANPSPANGAGNIALTPTLTWTDTGATTYTIRFGTVDPPPQVATGLQATSYAPGTLSGGTTYYWQVIAVNSLGSTQGPVWTFNTTRRGKKK